MVRRLIGGLSDAGLSDDGGAVDCRERICRWEDELFRRFPVGHGILGYDEALDLIKAVFHGAGRTPPNLDLVEGFSDPTIGGYADVPGHRIYIERGCLYRFLVLHECAHLLVPRDRQHGPGFIYILQGLYHAALRIPQGDIAASLRQYALGEDVILPA